MGMIRSLISMAMLGVFLVVGFTVPLGQRTLFGHIRNIWASDAAQELVEGVKESSEPLVDRVKRGVEAGLSEDTPATEQPESGTPVAQGEPSAPQPTGPVATDGKAPGATKAPSNL